MGICMASDDWIVAPCLKSLFGVRQPKTLESSSGIAILFVSDKLEKHDDHTSMPPIKGSSHHPPFLKQQ